MTQTAAKIKLQISHQNDVNWDDFLRQEKIKNYLKEFGFWQKKICLVIKTFFWHLEVVSVLLGLQLSLIKLAVHHHQVWKRQRPDRINYIVYTLVLVSFNTHRTLWRHRTVRLLINIVVTRTVRCRGWLLSSLLSVRA